MDDDTNHDHTITVPFVAGKLKQFVSVWQTINSDYFILSAVKGVKIELATSKADHYSPRIQF